MARNSTYNILMYSHDTYGLGHIRRTMAIASHLRAPGVNILILTGSPIAGRFAFPEQVDFVRIPGMIKKTNEEYLPLSIKIHPRHALDIRQNIIKATAKSFQPRLFIVDKEPLGLRKEILPTLRWIRRSLPRTRTVLGLRDIMDDADTIRRNWEKRGIHRILETLYTEIWVYGRRDFYDPVAEYGIGESVARNLHFTGYIPRKVPPPEEVKRERERHCVRENERLVVVTTGGGGDGYAVVDAFLSMLEARKTPAARSRIDRAIIVTGPFMPRDRRASLFKRAKRLGVRAFHFYRQMEKLLAAADVAVCMGGYNTLCEILSQGTVPLIVPRETPRLEQRIRALAFHRQGLAEYIPWTALSPETMGDALDRLLARPEPYREAIAAFSMTGLAIMRQRLAAFRRGEP